MVERVSHAEACSRLPSSEACVAVAVAVFLSSELVSKVPSEVVNLITLLASAAPAGMLAITFNLVMPLATIKPLSAFCR